ncbi:hypothetical protein NXY56_007195 [Leishmania guyanensis]
MEALVHNCPATDDGEDALLTWTREWLAFDRTTDPCATLVLSGEVSAPHPRRMGSALADVLVVLYIYVVRHGGRIRGGSPVAATNAMGARTTLGDSTVASLCTLGRGSDEAQWIVLVDLVQFLFSCWELLLMVVPTPSSKRAPASHTCMAIPSSYEKSPQCHTGVADYSQASSLLSPMLLGETGDDVPDKEEAVQLAKSHENVAQVTLESVHDVVRRVIREMFCVADDDAAAIEAGHNSGVLRSHAAIVMFLKLLQASPLLRRLVGSSPLLIRSIARYLLPRLVSLRHRQQQQQQQGHHHASGGLRGRSEVAATAIEALLSTLYIVSSSTALSVPLWPTQPLSAVASQLSCYCCLSDREVAPASALADRDGATLLETLCAVLQSCCGAHLSPLRLQALRLLHLLSSSPTTRRALFSSCCHGEVSTTYSMLEEQPGPTDAAAAAAVVFGSQRPSALDVAPHLLPLLLSSEDEEESVQLTCSVLQLILLHVQSPCHSLRSSGPCSDTVHTTNATPAGFTAAFTEGGFVGAADEVSGIKVAVHLASHIKDYTMQALYSCTNKTGYALVGLLDHAASVVAGARALLLGANVEAGPSVLHDDATVRWEQQQDWRVIFHVAEVDIALFEALLKGSALHDALVPHNSANVSDDSSGARLDWDEVASSIFTVASQEHGAQLSLYTFLRCLDALAAGMRGNIQALWSNRLCELVHIVLKRVDGQVQDAKWRPADTADAMRTFSALVISGAPHGNFNDETPSTTAAPHARDAVDRPLLRRMLDSQTLHLLTRVTAAYLTASCDILLPLGVQLLMDVTHTGRLIAMHCPEPSGYPTMLSTSVEESRCLLRIATLLTRTQLESWTTSEQTFESKEGHMRYASNGVSPAGQNITMSLYSRPGRPHIPQYTSRSSGSANGDEDRVRLMDVLLGLYPEAPELLEARTTLIHVLARRDSAAHAQPEFLAAHASAFIGAASLTEVAMSPSGLQASLLLSLATLGCCPCVGRQELCVMLEDRCRSLCSHLQRTASSESTRGPAALWSTKAVAEGDAVDSAVVGTASDSDDTDDMGRLLDALQEMFRLLVVSTLWYGGTVSNPSRLWPALSSQAPAAASAADHIFSEAHAQALMTFVEDDVGLREGLCQFLFDLHTQYRVDVTGFLTFLQSEEDHAPRQRPQQAQAPSPVLFAAAVLSATLYDGDEPRNSTRMTGVTSPLRTYTHALRSVHWLANTSSQQASVPLSVELLLRSVFRVAQRELLFLNRGHHPQDQRTDLAPAVTTASPAAIASLQFVCNELAFQQHGLQSGALPVQQAIVELAARKDAQRSAPDSAPGVALSIYVLREHLLPLLLRTNSNTVVHRKDLSMSVAALEYSTVLLRLMSVALWPLAPATCTSLDAVLAEYAMSRARQLLALTTAELTHTDGAAHKLLYPLLQLLYLLLMRAHKVDVVRRYGTDLLFFAFRARHAAIARANLIAFGGVERGDLTDSDEDDVHVCVIASIVYIMAQQIADTRRKGAIRGIGVGCSGGAGAVGGGGLVPPSLKDMPWYVWIPIFRYYRCLQTAVSRTANDHAAREQQRSMVWTVVSGVEYVIRLCGVSHLVCCSHGAASAQLMETVPQVGQGGRNAPHAGEGPNRDERQAATILISWCAELILTPWMSSEDFNNTHLNVTVVSARLLYLLFYRFRALAATSVWFNPLVLSCMRQTTPSRFLQLPLVAEGWLLAALMQVLPSVQYWYAYDDYVKGSTMRFFEKPEIVARVTLVPCPPPREPPAHATAVPHIAVLEAAATASAVRRVGACGGWADLSTAEPELSCVLRILVTACRQYELSPERLHSRRRLEVIIPLGLQFVAELPVRESSSLLEYTFPYTIPFTRAGTPPLLLVFRCFTDQLNE